MNIRCVGYLFAIGAASAFSLAQKPAELRTATDIASELWKTSGIAVYVDSKVAREKAPMPSLPPKITAEELERHLDALVKALPSKGAWAKLHLPPAPKGKVWKGDDVVEFALAQARLFGTVGKSLPDSVEILSQRLSADEAKPVMEALQLRPVYVVTMAKGNFQGVWSTTYGEMRLAQNGRLVSGTYTSGNGRIEGIATGDKLQLRWFEQGSQRGGPGVFVLSEDGESFTGEWAYDSNPDSISQWSGKRISRR